jgi:type I restriction enzyme M protein
MARHRTRAESRTRYYIREEAVRRGWNTDHVGTGGDCLEENEILAHLPELGLGLERPDFLFCLSGVPAMTVEAKNESGKLGRAIGEAISYADRINEGGKFHVPLAVGAAGEPDKGFLAEVRYRAKHGWIPLESNGFPLTTLPSKREAELALTAADGTTSVSVPANHEFIDAALELSAVMRAAKVEAPLRPKVIGALIVAMYEGDVDTAPSSSLASINRLVREAISSSPDLAAAPRRQLIDALLLSSADFDRLSPAIGRIVATLRRLNVRPVLQTDTDFLGMFYEAFLRYGYDNKSLGIVFTPRHITQFSVDLLEPSARDRVIDIASGTGGFLVAAFDRMMREAKSPQARVKVKDSIFGFETNPTVWALSLLNMFFRGDGKSHMELASCFSPKSRRNVEKGFTHAFLNPPFSQVDEPERDFLDTAMDALEPGGELAAIVYAGVFADDLHRTWREAFLRKHSLRAMISMPEDLFYPTAAPTTIVVARAHEPQRSDQSVFMARVWNDGFTKLKSRRVEAPGSQLPEILDAFHRFEAGDKPQSSLVAEIEAAELAGGDEWSPQQWLPQPTTRKRDRDSLATSTLRSVYQAVAQFPDLADEALDEFTETWAGLPNLPTRKGSPLEEFFEIANGRSAGERNYEGGQCPYVSSGDATNSIVRLVDGAEGERFTAGALTVTAFGAACIQPWPFVGRGNGGSSVRVLTPKFNMSLREMLWFAAQINAQRWRFFYARMAIKSRLEQLVVRSPTERQRDEGDNLAYRLRAFRDQLNALAELP